jgi:hypothetical protein
MGTIPCYVLEHLYRFVKMTIGKTEKVCALALNPTSRHLVLWFDQHLPVAGGNRSEIVGGRHEPNEVDSKLRLDREEFTDLDANARHNSP